MALYDYRIKAGWNQALVDLVNIEDITPSTDVAFYPPEGISSFTPGAFRVRGDGLVTTAGYGSVTWVFGLLTRLQYKYLMDTYGGGGYSGKVTIYTRVGASAYGRYNAVIRIPPSSELKRQGVYWTDVPIRFIRLEAL